ncbi:chemotaxis protein CheC [Oribacterium sp. oral taxon 102]|uniref:chemotaxis protein CheC n=1 Tax=Oribacterium sp. oral taxon 102 TaxID=671214 RepID=UPI0015BC59B0|nr:chemotaxis protein CheC [Oribacterium sp. oral taxon 102]NWO21792.1 chemotaxis protein CheC [Oribacterium sp. oral taxon 102]
MKIRRYEEMNLQELDVMKEIGSIGTSHAATALSKLVQKEVRITIPQVHILDYNQAVKRIGNEEEIVGATLVQMSGDLNGLMLFLYNADYANCVLERLLGRCYTGFEAMDEMAHSALTEAGNIIICSYVNAFTGLTGMDVSLSVPSSAVNMLGGILTVPMAELGNETDRLMSFDAEFLMEGRKLPSWLLMLPHMESLNEIMTRLGV